MGADGFWLTSGKVHGFDCLVIAGKTDRGVLYGAFALLRKIARGESISTLDQKEQPSAQIRWVDQWDNLDGRIERGYAGPSIFFDNGAVRADLTRAAAYARLLASIGVNGCTINNVNANPQVLEDSFIAQVARIADAMAPGGTLIIETGMLLSFLKHPFIFTPAPEESPYDPTSVTFFNERALISTLESLGFSKIECRSVLSPSMGRYENMEAFCASKEFGDAAPEQILIGRGTYVCQRAQEKADLNSYWYGVHNLNTDSGAADELQFFLFVV